MKPLKVGIVGAGRRVENVYLPAFRALADAFTVGGIASRTRGSSERLAAAEGARAYDSVAALCADLRPDLMVVAVDARLNADAALEAVATKCPVLLETPIASDVPSGHRVVRAAARSGQPVGVVEQKPFLPFECFKRQLIAAGAIGRVLVVENDFRSVRYHAVAQLRRYLPADARPLWVQATRAVYDLDAFGSTDGQDRSGDREQWTLASMTFTDGSTAVHHTSSAFKKAPFRILPSLRVYGSRGSIVNDDIAVLDSSGRTVRLTIDRAGGLLNDRIAARLPNGLDVVWQNPVAGAGLDDDQVGVALHLLAMRDSVTGSGSPLYSPHDALVDIELVEAMERSGRRGGAPVFAGHACADPRCRPISLLTSVRARAEHLARSAAGVGGLHRILGAARRAGSPV